MMNKPLVVNTDSAVKDLKPHEAMFIKDVEVAVNKNGNDATANPSGEGQNDYVLTPIESLVAIPGYLLPSGYNKHIGSFESKQTNEVYSLTYNENGNHCIHVVNGDTGVVEKIISDENLQFTDQQINYIADCRVALRVVRNAAGEIVEKILLITDFGTWQKWINTLAAKNTDGFNASTYPYWEVKQPHFDRRELVEWAPRPPMYMPEGEVVPNTTADEGNINRIVDKSFELCYDVNYTDGRETCVSPFSLPQTVKTTEFLSNPDLIPKKIKFTLYACSPLVEKINIYIRQTAQTSLSDLERTYGDWYLYETLYKYAQSKNNAVIGTEYWLRTDPWDGRNYDSDRNTFEYVFDNSRSGVPVDQKKFRYQNDMPQVSCAMAEAGDSVILMNNRYDYDNVDLSEKLQMQVNYRDDETCVPKLRTVSLYCYVGRERVNQSYSKGVKAYDCWMSQVGYHVGEDKQERFGGIMFETGTEGRRAHLPTDGSSFKIDANESKYFKLDFADREGFRCYAKGTPFYADCKWYVCDKDFNLTPVSGLLDAENQSDKDFIKNTLINGNFFVGKFTFSGLPARIYSFAIGRHNVNSNEDYRGQSTYVMGIADSSIVTTTTPSQTSDINYFPIKAMTPDAIVSRSKEIEVDCTDADVDIWQTGKDTFYIFCPFGGAGRDSTQNNVFDLENPMDRWSFNEGYLLEERSTVSTVPMELFNYEPTTIDHLSSGLYTDKNGFWFAYIWGDKEADNWANIRFSNKANCSTLSFVATRASGEKWKPNNLVYFSGYNSNTVGAANRVLIRGTITSLAGVPLSRISVTLQDGSTAYTDDAGEFEIIAHNGLNVPRVSNIYISAGGNFTITLANCGQIPVFVYDETCAYYPPCLYPSAADRIYLQNIDLQVDANAGDIQSAKSGASYFGAAVLFDYAGRATWVNKLNNLDVSTFVQRGNTRSAYFSWTQLAALGLDSSDRTKEFKWLALYVSKFTNYRSYFQWVGDKIEFLDQNGNPTDNTQNASLVRVSIQSLIETNFKNNFTLLSSYQFSRNDRMRIYDDGDGNLLDTATYGELIDSEIQGTNYNQAAINAKLVLPGANTVLAPETSLSATDPATMYLKYDPRFDLLKGKTGFWIELYTPEYFQEKLNYGECEACFAIIDGEIKEYVSGGPTAPVYTPVTSGDIRFYDTYYLRRVIIGNGKFISHFFESPNITDTWGVNAISSGRSNAENADARQMFYVDDMIKSDAFVISGTRNGLATFHGPAPDTGNRKSFKRADFGGIVAAKNEGSIIFVLCQRNWFTVDYNMVFIRASSPTMDWQGGGVVVANLTNNVSEPHQKVGSQSGCEYKDIATVMFINNWVGWHDSKNGNYTISDWGKSFDITEILDEGRPTGISSYYNVKSEAVESYNEGKADKDKFDIVAGFDYYREQLFITFRPRRNRETSGWSYRNKRFDIDLLHQETVVFSIKKQRWLRWAGFTPEGYARLRGNIYAQEMISFANAKPYFHNSGQASDWLNFYGDYVRPVIKFSLSEASDMVKILKGMKIDSSNVKWVADLIYSDEPNSFSYFPSNQVAQREGLQYVAVLRDMGTYAPIDPDQSFRSMLWDGKPVRGTFIVIRLLPEPLAEGEYFELNVIDSEVIASVSNKQKEK